MYKRKNIHFLIEEYAKNPRELLPELVGYGTARNVFRLDETHVVKISNDPLFNHIKEGYMMDGIGQTMKEIAVYKNIPFKYRYLLNPIVDKGFYGGYAYVVQEYVDVVGTKEDYSGTYEDTCVTLDYTQEEIEERVNDIEDICDMFKLNTYDILNFTANLGIKQDTKELLIIDYGYPM